MCWGYFFRFMHLRYTQQIRNVTKETGNLRTVTEAFLVHIMCDWKPDNHIMAIPISLKSLILSHFFPGTTPWESGNFTTSWSRNLVPHSTSVHTGGGKRLLLRTFSEFQFSMVFLFISSFPSRKRSYGKLQKPPFHQAPLGVEKFQLLLSLSKCKWNTSFHQTSHREKSGREMTYLLESSVRSEPYLILHQGPCST